jgi:hypothetical protein
VLLALLQPLLGVFAGYKEMVLVALLALAQLLPTLQRTAVVQSTTFTGWGFRLLLVKVLDSTSFMEPIQLW